MTLCWARSRFLMRICHSRRPRKAIRIVADKKYAASINDIGLTCFRFIDAAVPGRFAQAFQQVIDLIFEIHHTVFLSSVASCHLLSSFICGRFPLPPPCVCLYHGRWPTSVRLPRFVCEKRCPQFHGKHGSVLPDVFLLVDLRVAVLRIWFSTISASMACHLSGVNST